MVHSFKQPSHEELCHSFMWRVMMHMPNRGHLGVFNRSYYEDVLVVRVHDLQKRATTCPPAASTWIPTTSSRSATSRPSASWSASTSPRTGSSTPPT
ncbi:hypothetical protein [Paratractidigestivibacter sp.]|uniref:hypothetical protein n=1 Tax=Paratractidigestivibacter sp. TaxID=2847316 RepID=UPI0039F54563